MATGWLDESTSSGIDACSGWRDRIQAYASLRGLLTDPLNRMQLRAVLAEELGFADVGRLGDHEVIQRLASRMVSGRLGLDALRLSPSPVGAGSAPEEATEEQAPGEAGVIETGTHFIEIELVDEEDQPIPKERYRITFPNGTTREGRLDANGLASFRSLQSAGECQVSFPGLDQDAWGPA